MDVRFINSKIQRFKNSALITYSICSCTKLSAGSLPEGFRRGSFSAGYRDISPEKSYPFAKDHIRWPKIISVRQNSYPLAKKHIRRSKHHIRSPKIISAGQNSYPLAKKHIRSSKLISAGQKTCPLAGNQDCLPGIRTFRQSVSF
jgi:hypothetical protein